MVDAEIAEVISKKTTKQGSFTMEVNLSFPNLAGTTITAPMELEDTKPHLARFEKGKKVKFRLDTRKGTVLPWIINDGEVFKRKSALRWLFAFSIVYAIVTFLVHHKLHSDGQG